MAACVAACTAFFAVGSLAQTGGEAAPARPDLQSQAYLMGAAYAHSDLSTDRPGGMMFLPGRGLIRWETQGKTLAEQEELKTEAIGAADARVVQAELDAQAAAREAEQHRAADAIAYHEQMGLMAEARTVPTLNLHGVTGTRNQAGGVTPLNRAAVQSQLANALGVHNGAGFKNKGRLYMFGAVSGRGVGMNLLHDDDGAWKNAGLSSDKGGFVGQRQAGLALRKGGAQAAISFVQEKTHAQLLGITSIKDHRAMLNFTFVPKFSGH